MHPDKMTCGNQWIRLAVQRYEQPLVRYAARLLQDVSRGQEVVQETFLRLCRHGVEVTQPKLEAWLYTVCRNCAMDVRRKESRMSSTSNSQFDQTPGNLPHPSALLEQDETHSMALRELAQLPMNQQEVIRLKFQDNLSYKQIAEVTHCTVGHVGYLIHTGLKNLRQRLDKIEGSACCPGKQKLDNTPASHVEHRSHLQ